MVKKSLINDIQSLTNLDNPNSVQQMKNWLSENGFETESLSKSSVSEMLKTAPYQVHKVLSLRQQLAKSSVKKYTAMKNAVCKDSRARGMFQFYGANRTGRFAGRLVQLQNLPQNHMPDLTQARGLVKCGNYDALSILYDDIPDTLSQLIRTAFIPQHSCKFIVADFSAIEARVLAWLAGEKWRNKVFSEGKDIYCSSASQMGLSEDELQPLVCAWRNSNPSITKLWWDIDKCVKETVTKRIPTETNGISFTYESGFLFITLPSGRRLAYVKPRIGINKFGGESVTYEGIGSTKKWERLESYGPKFCENIIQAIARDILLYAMQTLKNYRIIAHVHDEVIIECQKDVSVNTICEQMSRTPPWAKGLLLRADGYECQFYMKD